MTKHLITLYLLLFSSVVLAVDSSALWLPKKYKDARPKLMLVAKEAEATDRCKFVVAGELIVSRSTKDSYHFVITCRDENRSTYNMVYKYPVDSSDNVELLLEQNAPKAILKKEMQTATETVKREKALELCNNALDQEAKILGKHTKYAEEVTEQTVVLPWIFGFNLPISAIDNEGQEVRYMGKCQVAKNADVDLILEEAPVSSDMAKVICREALKGEAILLGNFADLPEEMTEKKVEAPWLFGFSTPMISGGGSAQEERYVASCLVDNEADVEVVLEQEPVNLDIAKMICREAVKGEAILLGNFAGLPEEMTGQKVEAPWLFGFSMPIISGEGSEQEERYVASCRVDNEADVEVVLEQEPVNRDIALDICFEVMEEEATLIGYIDIIEQEIRDELPAADWVFRFILPFNSKNGMGDDIRYNADCRVDTERDVDVEITIDVKAIPDYCIYAMEAKTKMMLNKQVLRKEVQPPKLIQEDYFTVIPFTAKSPTGLLLNYQANCTVTSAGKSTIKISRARK